MKHLALRPTTAPTVLTNMGPLFVSAALTCSQCHSRAIGNFVLFLSTCLFWPVKRRRNTHRHDYSDIDSGKKVCCLPNIAIVQEY